MAWKTKPRVGVTKMPTVASKAGPLYRLEGQANVRGQNASGDLARVTISTPSFARPEGAEQCLAPAEVTQAVMEDHGEARWRSSSPTASMTCVPVTLPRLLRAAPLAIARAPAARHAAGPPPQDTLILLPVRSPTLLQRPSQLGNGHVHTGGPPAVSHRFLAGVSLEARLLGVLFAEIDRDRKKPSETGLCRQSIRWKKVTPFDVAGRSIVLNAGTRLRAHGRKVHQHRRHKRLRAPTRTRAARQAGQ